MTRSPNEDRCQLSFHACKHMLGFGSSRNLLGVMPVKMFLIPVIDDATECEGRFPHGHQSRREKAVVFCLHASNDRERIPRLGIVVTTGRHPPPPRVAGPAEAQLASTPVAPHLCTAGKNKHSITRGAVFRPADLLVNRPRRKKGDARRPFCRRQPIARLLRWTALRSKNSAWLTSAETVDCWYGLETRKAGSGRSPVRKRSG
jgi:hypothetical protein